jgi:hypothetical protein
MVGHSQSMYDVIHKMKYGGDDKGEKEDEDRGWVKQSKGNTKGET